MGKIYEALELAKKNREPHKPELTVIPFLGDEQEPLLVDRRRAPHPDLEVLKDPASIMAECFRFLRSKVTRPATGDPPRTILVTSAISGEGKTFVASNLAAMISQSPEEFVLLIDADLRAPKLHSTMGMTLPREGLCTYLSQNAPLPSLLVKTAMDRLSFLPAGHYKDNPAELLSSSKMKALLQEVRDRYSDRFVIIDSPPIELAPETSVIANEVDGIIFVVRYASSPRQSVKSAMEKMQKEKVLGVVFNGCDEVSGLYSRYGYGKYGYGKKK